MSINPNHNWSKRLPLYTIGVLFLMLLASACQTFKGKGSRRHSKEADSNKTSFVQNFTSKYNILYNANFMLNAERKAIYEAAHKNYQVRLTVFDEPTANGDPHKTMDSLIQKAYKIVNTRQQSKYVDEAYYIIGRAYYLKGSYYTAAEFFDKLIKDAEDQQKYKPIAYAWKSRALLQINKLAAAEKVIDSAFMFLGEDKKSRTFVNAAMANYLVRVGREGEAIPYLEYALESNKDRYDKGRWQFLLGQLYRDNGQPEAAYSMFSKLAKSNVPFDMSFEADLQAAFLAGDGGGITDRVKPLRKMLKEGKNMDYKDQILYEIGRIYLEDADEENAFRFFNRALAEPNGSVYQTTETYLTIADYHFARGEYRRAQHYYDSTATVLPTDYTDVNKIRRKLVYMEELTKLYEENLWLDTLLTLGKLNEVARTEQALKFAGISLLEKQKELDRQAYLAKKGKKSEANTNNVHFNNPFAVNNEAEINTISANDQFYFNNQDALLLGASEFKRKWGNRQLKDDWRFSADNTKQLAVQSDPNANTPTPLAPKDSFDAAGFVEAEKERYLAVVPTSQEAFDRTLTTIHDNMIVIGNIYRDYTRDNSDAIKAYEAFLTRFPNTEAGAEVYYSLFRMYDGIDPDKSLDYKNRLINLFPNSLHALVARDPYYMDKVNRDKRILDRTFERLFARYVEGDHVEVIKEANEALEGAFQTTGMVAQIEYLKALAIGRVGRVSDFTNALAKIIEKYPNDSLITPLARENIAFIDNNPVLFINRVNALQDIDKGRIAFVDEPDMTPWPALNIDGDYRTGTALVQEKPTEEPIVEEEKEETAEQLTVAEEKRQEIEMLLANERTTKPKEVNAAKGIDLNNVSGPQKKQDVIVADVGAIDEGKETAQLEDQKMVNHVGAGNIGIQTDVKLDANAVNIGDVKINYGPNEYRDKELFPDTATYFFTINVIDPRVNLAPSRYGIGQFNRSRYARTNINHQLRVVNAENQLLFIGPFESYEEVKTYENRILPLLSEIMKVPQEDYNTFIITRETIGTLTDGIQIKNYHQIYIEQ